MMLFEDAVNTNSYTFISLRLFVCFLLVVWRDLDGESTFKILTSTHFRCKMEVMTVQSGVKGSDYYNRGYIINIFPIVALF